MGASAAMARAAEEGRGEGARDGGTGGGGGGATGAVDAGAATGAAPCGGWPLAALSACPAAVAEAEEGAAAPEGTADVEGGAAAAARSHAAPRGSTARVVGLYSCTHTKYASGVGGGGMESSACGGAKRTSAGPSSDSKLFKSSQSDSSRTCGCNQHERRTNAVREGACVRRSHSTEAHQCAHVRRATLL